MKSISIRSPRLLLPLLALLTAHAGQAASPEAIAAVEEAGRINGIALACGNGALSLYLKKTVIEIATKTREIGEKFEEATQRGFLDQTKTPACPDPVAQKARADKAVEALKAQFPAEQPR